MLAILHLTQEDQSGNTIDRLEQSLATVEMKYPGEGQQKIKLREMLLKQLLRVTRAEAGVMWGKRGKIRHWLFPLMF
jgi:hypothetical protein